MNRLQLTKIAPKIGIAIADTFLRPLNTAMDNYGIDTPQRQACFVAQLLHESNNFTSLVENLNYSPAGLIATFGNRVSDDQAHRLGRMGDAQRANQVAIANLVYNGRMGNRTDSDDGWRFRGRGPIQLTGRDMYMRCGAAIGYDLLSSPELLQDALVGCLAAAWYWSAGNPHGVSLNKYADLNDVGAISRAINGGNNGLVERYDLTRRAIAVLSPPDTDGSLA